MENEKIEFQTEEITKVEEKKDLKEFLLPALAVVFLIIAGIFSGYFLSVRQYGKVPLSPGEAGEVIEKGMVVGVDNPDIFRDTAEGVIEVNDGSFTDEGTHKLIREGGESQTAYLISSVLDLDKLVGRKVKIWGETFAAQKAGWLMDVGKVEVLE
jgi:hypothetical protein